MKERHRWQAGKSVAVKTVYAWASWGAAMLRPYMTVPIARSPGHIGLANWVETGAIWASCGGVGRLVKFGVWRDVAVGVG